MLSRNQQGMAGASFLSLVCGAFFAIYMQLDFRKAMLAALTGALFAASSWMFLAEMWNVALIFFIPVAIICGFGAFPIVRAYVRKSDDIAEGAVGAALGFVGRWFKRIGGQ